MSDRVIKCRWCEKTFSIFSRTRSGSIVDGHVYLTAHVAQKHAKQWARFKQLTDGMLNVPETPYIQRKDVEIGVKFVKTS